MAMPCYLPKLGRLKERAASSARNAQPNSDGHSYTIEPMENMLPPNTTHNTTFRGTLLLDTWYVNQRTKQFEQSQASTMRGSRVVWYSHSLNSEMLLTRCCFFFCLTFHRTLVKGIM